MCLKLTNSGSNNQNPPTVEELLVSHGLWSFMDFDILQIVDAGPSTLTAEDMEADLIDIFLGTTIVFNSDFSGTLSDDGVCVERSEGYPRVAWSTSRAPSRRRTM